MSKVTPIRVKLRGAVEIPKHLAAAIAEQQARAWELRSLLQALGAASERVDDLPACISGLVRCADAIEGGLGLATLTSVAAEYAGKAGES